jgi:hypothetical protein
VYCALHIITLFSLAHYLVVLYMSCLLCISCLLRVPTFSSRNCGYLLSASRTHAMLLFPPFADILGLSTQSFPSVIRVKSLTGILEIKLLLQIHFDHFTSIEGAGAGALTTTSSSGSKNVDNPNSISMLQMCGTGCREGHRGSGTSLHRHSCRPHRHRHFQFLYASLTQVAPEIS